MNMKLSLLAVVLCLGLACSAPVQEAEPVADENPEARFLSGIHQVTTESRRSGEGYFSPDGSMMVYQSEVAAENPFFQIYEIELATGKVQQISNGTGKTTCAFYQAGTGNIEFASTHHDPQSAVLQQEALERRAAGVKNSYSWDYDPQMEIYVYERESGELKRLTDVLGYDAEGSYSPDGEWIVFTSMRDIYGKELTEAEATQMDADPSFFGEIYLMRADGSEQQRLTEAPGYDGGPFFTADGSQIVWRRFDDSGRIADVWVMNTDGSEQRQVTDFKTMSWAPYPHPSGKYFIFLSNKHGYENFELFIVDTEGAKEPVRVTFTPGMDGLPVFSPDGDSLAWTSKRAGADVGAQIWMGDWNHTAALQALEEAPARGTEAAPAD
jgi:Tol biopolymer transport system component